MYSSYENLLRFKELILFELYFQIKRFSTWVFAIVLLGLTFFWVMGHVDLAQDLGIKVHSLVIITGMTAFPNMLALIIISAFAGETAMRDAGAKLEQIIYTTSVGRITYLGSRFLALYFIVTLIMVLAVPLSIFIAYFIEENNTALYSPIRASAHLMAIVLFTLPNIFIGTGFVYSIVLLFKSTMAGYIGGMALFLCSALSMDLLAGPSDLWELGKLLDPSGAAVIKEFRYNGMDFRPGWSGPGKSLIINRCIWILFTSAMLISSFSLFQFSFRPTVHSKRKVFLEQIKCLPAIKLPISLSPPQMHHYFGKHFQQVSVLASRSFLDLFRSPGSLIVLLTFFLLFLILPDLHQETYGEDSSTSTSQLLILMNHPLVRFLCFGVIILFAGQLIWRERDLHMDEIFDTLPLSNLKILLGSYIGLWLMLIFFQLVQAATAIAVQVDQGYYDFEVIRYLEVLFILQLPDYLLFSVVVMTIQVIVNNKYLGHTLGLLFYFFTNFSYILGLSHDLFIFGSSMLKSHIIEGGVSMKWFILKAYWISWSGLFFLISIHLLPRGRAEIISRLGIKEKNVLKFPVFISSVVLILILALLYLYL